MKVDSELVQILRKYRFRTYLCRCGGSDEVSLVGHLNMPGAGVGLRVHCDGGHPEALGRAHDAAGDLAAVGDQQLSSKYIGQNDTSLTAKGRKTA